MQKPVQQTKKYFDYDDCFKWICQEYGKPPFDFWNFIFEYIGFENGSYIYLTDLLYAEDTELWQKYVVQNFVQEFGEDAEYWVEW